MVAVADGWRGMGLLLAMRSSKIARLCKGIADVEN